MRGLLFFCSGLIAAKMRHKETGMMTEKKGNHVSYRKDLPLYVERVLLEFSDENHSLSVTDIVRYLHECYSIDYSNDTVLKTLKAMMDGYEMPNASRVQSNDGDGRVGDGLSDSCCLKPRYRILLDPEMSKSSGVNKKGLYYAKRLLIDSDQIEHLANMLSLTSNEGSARATLDGILGEMSRYERQRIIESTRPLNRSSIIDLEATLFNIESLSEAISGNKYVSFKCHIGGNSQGYTCEGLPLRIEFDDGFYYLVTLAKNYKNKCRTNKAARTLFAVCRVDQIEPNSIEAHEIPENVENDCVKAAGYVKESYSGMVFDVEEKDPLKNAMRVLKQGAEAFIGGSVNRMPSNDMIPVVTIRCAQKSAVAKYIKGNFSGKCSELTMEGSEFRRFEITNVSFDGMKKWCLKWLSQAEVESPQRLRDAIVSEITQSAYVTL